MLKTTPVPAFSDNYIWLIHGIADPRKVAIVDPGDAEPVIKRLKDQDLEPAAILVTHHHWDHVGGVGRLVDEFGLPVYGPAGEDIPSRDFALVEGDTVALEDLGVDFSILDCPGHTAGHIAYYGHQALFCGDTLFSAGCGRLFEGTPEQMSESLGKFAALPGDTRIFCTHEYTLSNLRFASAVEPANRDIEAYSTTAQALREQGQPTLPSTLDLEGRVNPFMRCGEASVRSSAEHHAGRPLPDPVSVFATVRAWKDAF
jgi:hydroxyacylglutathione hydrolase